MDINTVFDQIFQEHPKAREGNTLRSRRPKSTLNWVRVTSSHYEAKGPRGGTHALKYNTRSNKITIARVAS